MEDLSVPSHSMLHSFCVKPNVKFDTQLDTEEIRLVLRAHPITLVPWILNGIFIIILAIFINMFATNIFSLEQFFVFNIGVGAFVFGYYWFNTLSYFFNVGVITNHRVIDIDFHAVIYKEETEARINKVEDITAKTGGYVASLFNFGNVFVQTAGSELNIEFKNVPRPSDVVKIINSVLP
jgi:hypothetical protein